MLWKLRAGVAADIRKWHSFRAQNFSGRSASRCQIHSLGHKCLFPVAPEQQPDCVTYFVHLNNEKGHMSLLGGSSVSCHMFHCCFSPFVVRAALASRVKGYLGMQKVWSWTEMHLQLADVSKKSTLVINHKDYEIIFCLCVFNQS